VKTFSIFLFIGTCRWIWCSLEFLLHTCCCVNPYFFY